LNGGLALPGHIEGVIGKFPKMGSYPINHLISALGTEQNGDQKRVGIDMFQRYGGIRIQFGQSGSNVVGSFLSIHSGLATQFF
jgi:hypothetical protein